MCNINEYGYVSNFNEIPGIQNERILDGRIVMENDFFIELVSCQIMICI